MRRLPLVPMASNGLQQRRTRIRCPPRPVRRARCEPGALNGQPAEVLLPAKRSTAVERAPALRARRALHRRRRHRALAARGRRRRRPGDGDCASSPTSKTFMPWLDPANCVPAPGAMPRQRAHGTSEAEPPCWRAKEPFRVGAPDDQASLRLPPGSSAATAPMCIGIEHPTVRFSRNARPARCSTRSGSTRSSLTRQATTTSCRAGSSSAPATGCPPRHWSSASTRSP
jgi:hypothetical protein